MLAFYFWIEFEKPGLWHKIIDYYDTRNRLFEVANRPRDCTSGVRKIWKQPNRRCFQPKFAKVKALLYQWGLSGNKAILWAYGVMNWGLGFLESFMSSTCSILVILIVTRQVLLSPGSSQPYLCICIFYHSGEILWSFRIKHWDWCLLESLIYSIFSI